ncbi:MAG: hypothetical protein Q7S57_03520, partial [bacterium]|nr:hypothetical protein [bacterium]
QYSGRYVKAYNAYGESASSAVAESVYTITEPSSTASSTSTSPVTSIKLEGGTYDPKTKIRTINISQDGTLRLNVILPDPDQLRKATILINKKTYTLKRETRNGKVIFYVILTDFRHKIGKYPYTLFADYGSTQVKEKGVISITAPNNFVQLQDVNQNFRAVYKRTPTFTEWLKWAKEVLVGITKEKLQAKMQSGR